MSLVPLAPGDDKPDNAAFPAGRRDANTDLGQQLDLRQTNSWTLKLEEVSTAEMAEVLPTAYRLLLPTGYYYYSPLATRHSPLTTHHSPLTTSHQVLAINSLAPAILNGRLRAFIEASGPLPGQSVGAPPPLKFIVNVSAMEGRFYKVSP